MTNSLKNNIGKLVQVKAIPSWLVSRIEKGYCLLKPGLIGKIISLNMHGDKYGVEFNIPVWKTKPDGNYSFMDHGCGGSGKMHHCLYFLPGNLALEYNHNLKEDYLNQLSDHTICNNIGSIPNSDSSEKPNNLLLLATF